ncbi:MAG: hypothetical protein R2825_09285 [Saprospiraceae bacterium]
MSHLNGILYFSSGGNGNLMAVDMANGKIIWNIDSPDGEVSKKWPSIPAGQAKSRWCSLLPIECLLL